MEILQSIKTHHDHLNIWLILNDNPSSWIEMKIELKTFFPIEIPLTGEGLNYLTGNF